MSLELALRNSSANSVKRHWPTKNMARYKLSVTGPLRQEISHVVECLPLSDIVNSDSGLNKGHCALM